MVQETFGSNDGVKTGAERGFEGEVKKQGEEIERISQNAEVRAQGKPEQQKGGAAGREAVGSKNPADFDVRGGHAGGVEPQKEPLI